MVRFEQAALICVSAAFASGCGSGGAGAAETVWDGCPYWSPDGRTIAFARGDPDDQSDVWAVGDDGRAPRRLARTAENEEVLGWQSRSEIVVRRGKEVYGLDATTGRKRKVILHLRTDAFASLAPAGDRMAIRVPTPDNRYRAVRVLYLDTGRRRSLPRTYASALEWSANGSRLTYGARDLVMQLVTVDGEVLGVVKDTVTALPSPDGTEVAYVRIGKLFVWNVRNGSRRVLVAGAATEEDPEPLAWSPDGRTIFYRYLGVRAVDVRTRRKQLLLPMPRDRGADCLAVAPDGKRLAFDRVIFGGTAFGPPKDVSLVVMNSDGSARRFVPTK